MAYVLLNLDFSSPSVVSVFSVARRSKNTSATCKPHSAWQDWLHSAQASATQTAASSAAAGLQLRRVRAPHGHWLLLLPEIQQHAMPSEPPTHPMHLLAVSSLLALRLSLCCCCAVVGICPSKKESCCEGHPGGRRPPWVLVCAELGWASQSLVSSRGLAAVVSSSSVLCVHSRHSIWPLQPLRPPQRRPGWLGLA